mgnify:FL=1
MVPRDRVKEILWWLQKQIFRFCLFFKNDHALFGIHSLMTISFKHFTKKCCEICCNGKDNKLILKLNTCGIKELPIIFKGIK